MCLILIRPALQYDVDIEHDRDENVCATSFRYAALHIHARVEPSFCRLLEYFSTCTIQCESCGFCVCACGRSDRRTPRVVCYVYDSQRSRRAAHRFYCRGRIGAWFMRRPCGLHHKGYTSEVFLSPKQWWLYFLCAQSTQKDALQSV